VAPSDSRLAPPATATGPDRSKDDVRDLPGPTGADDPTLQNPSDDTGWVGVNEALYRLRSNWSPASHAGGSATVSQPRPAVLAAYQVDQAPPPDGEAAAAAAAAHRDILV
jgi:hypothetical protein